MDETRSEPQAPPGAVPVSGPVVPPGGAGAPLGSPVWPQRESFRRSCQDYMRAHGLDLDAMALLLGLKSGPGLRNLFYDSGRPGPRLRVLQKLAELTGRSLRDFLDDPGEDLGLPAEVTEGLSPAKRTAAKRIMAVLSSSQLTDAQAITLAAMVRNMLEFTDAHEGPGG